MTETIGFITARAGSKGIPRKNVKLLAGKPLLAWTLEAAQSACSLARVILSTDDPDIAAIGRQYGAETPFRRPAELASDDASHVSVVEHALDWYLQQLGQDAESLMLLQPTSPLRTADDIDAAVALAQTQNANAIVSVCNVNQHPYLSKMIASDGSLQDFMPTDIGYLRRQALPTLYYPNGALYWVRTESFRTSQTFFPRRTYPYIMPADRSLDLDTLFDFYLAELILRDRLVAA